MSYYIAANTTVDAVNSKLIWNSDGYYIVGDEEWQDITFEADMIYESGKIGFVPRVYADNMYMEVTMENILKNESTGETQTYISMDVQVVDQKIHLSDHYIEEMVQGSTYSLKAVIQGTNYKIYVNNIPIFNIEYSSMVKGRVGAYAHTGNSCTRLEVSASFSDGWISNINDIPGAIISQHELDNEDKYTYMMNTPDATSALLVQQYVDVVGGNKYILSYDYEGTARTSITEVDGLNRNMYQEENRSSATWSRESHGAIFISSDCTKVLIQMIVDPGNEAKINNVQFEQHDYASSYIHNESTMDVAVRNDSIVTYPYKDNLETSIGTVSMFVKPSVTYTGSLYTPTLFEASSESGGIHVFYDGANSMVTLQYGGSTDTVKIAQELNEEEWYHVVAKWSPSEISIHVNTAKTERAHTVDFTYQPDLIRIGHGRDGNHFSGAIDEVVIYKKNLNEEEIQAIYESNEAISDNAEMIMRASFDYAIGNFDKSIIEATLSPKYGSPIVVEKEDGTIMRKVSFFDYVTGEYRTWNEEQIIYDGVSDQLELSYDGIDQDSFDVSVKDHEGIEYGAPYNVEGNMLSLNLTDAEKNSLNRKELYVSYQLKDSYTVDHNIGVADSFRIDIGKHDGQPVKITYEGNDLDSQKLATMIEMNPMLNPNHEGFLYITKNVEKIAAFKVRATPNDLPANGSSESLIVVEPVDSQGNFISHCNLRIRAERGEIITAYDQESIRLRDRAGRFLYRYRAPVAYVNVEKAEEIKDHISIIDEETGLGVQVPITLVVLDVIPHLIESGENAYDISEKYGVTVEDIAQENEMSMKELIDYIPVNPGEVIMIPMNYSSGLMRRDKDVVHDERMITYILGFIGKYMGVAARDLPSGLGNILDLNSDGMINVYEVEWLNERKYTGALQQKYTELKTWEKTNTEG